jgi:hypothetical protein
MCHGSVESAFTYCSYVVARIVPEPHTEAIWEISEKGSNMEKVQQLSGKGKSGLEAYPEIHHFDLEPDEFFEFLVNPRAILERVGLDARRPRTVIFPSWVGLADETTASAERGRGTPDGGTPPPRKKVCCVVTKDATTCTVQN